MLPLVDLPASGEGDNVIHGEFFLWEVPATLVQESL